MIMKVDQATVLVVLGMHRSGTSAITRALEALGVTLGDNLMPPAENNNEKGFFEDLDIHHFNTRLLRAQNTAWDRLNRIDPTWSLAPEQSAWRHEAIEILRSKLANTRLFAFKDPQTCLLLPFWQSVLSELRVQTHYLICLRNPISVAESLHRRDGIHPMRGQLLWLFCQMEILRNTEDMSRILVEYDAVIESPFEQLQRIAQAFLLEPPVANSCASQVFQQDFLSHTLRHNRYAPEHLTDRTRVLTPVENLYQAMHQLAESPLPQKLGHLLDACEASEAALTSLAPLIQALDETDHQRLQAVRQDELILRQSDELDCLRTQLSVSIAECSTAWHMHEQLLHERHELAAQLSECLVQQSELRDELKGLLASHSWRITQPLRALRRHHKNPLLLARRLLSAGARLLWRALPLSVTQKRTAKHLLFRHGAFFLNKTQAYRDWEWSQHANPRANTAASAGPLKWIDEPVQSIPRLQRAALDNVPVRLIAFYLPQFHTIPENDNWWGEGFTEWTNVRPAIPLYEGHYQPHVPSDLGYYDLLEDQIQYHQVELAQQYGLGGFCFYFYWFGGKRLLESPVEKYLKNAELDFPFCLCWANENWSRRWDGLDDHILIGQSHSADDDLAFITHIARYLRDPRYIRIDGKPLLLVYRPSLLPDAKATAARWRTWCQENDIGEIYLAYTQSFDNAPPARFGFDAAIEFPPNATQPPPVTDRVQPLNDQFRGQVFDWSIFPKRSDHYSKPPYPLFRGVCPSWDNTARRGNRSTSFVNSSPRGYQHWLLNAIRDTIDREPNADARLVFINAWNEWAEGAHLEPDQRHGYGFLEATRMACVRASITSSPSKPLCQRLALIIHAYYPDVLSEILDYLHEIDGIELQLYISCPPEKTHTVSELLKGCTHSWYLSEMPNRGRDVLPFLMQLPQVIEDGHDWVLKVHTKKSTHREDGDVWRRDLYDKLLTKQSILQARTTLTNSPEIGILGPAGHLVPMSFYWGSNANRVEGLACRLGVRPSDLKEMSFVAGTMFFARVQALSPLLNLALSSTDFEDETGQVDGTLAHALERTLSVSAHAAGLRVTSTKNINKAKPYAFADATH